MCSNGGWKLMEDEHKMEEDHGESVDTQVVERKRRLTSGSKTRTHRRYIQDIVSFLWNESKAAEEDLKFEHKEVVREHVVRVTLSGDTTEARGRTMKSAKEAAAKSMLQQIGPFIEDTVWQKHTEDLANSVPAPYKGWLPPIFDVRHISMLNCGGVPFKGEIGAPFYEVEVQLGAVTAISVTDNLNTSLSSLVKHLSSFLTTRDLPSMVQQPLDESLAEMEVFPWLHQPYVQTQGLIEVRLEGPKENLLLPPVDVWVMQQHLPGGQFPPQYGTRDSWGCMKVFYCHRCMVKMNGTMTLVKHVGGMKHWRKIGKFFINGQLRETFNPVGESFVPTPVDEEETEQEKQQRLSSTPKLCQNCLEENKREIAAGHCTSCQEYLCQGCCEAHGKTRLTKSHHLEHIPAPNIKHPVQDQENGIKVEKDNLKYLIAVYRCTTNRVGSAQRNKQEMASEKANAGEPGQPFAPPVYGGSGEFGAMYDNGNVGRMGWEDPTWGMMDQRDEQYGMQHNMQGMGHPGGQFVGPYMGGGPTGFGFPRGGGRSGNMGQGPRFARGYGRGYQKPAFNRGGFGQQIRKPFHRQSGEIIQPNRPEDSGNEAYTGMLGKRGYNSTKLTPKYSALPPPGHDQWNKIPSRVPGVDTSIAHIQGVGANFRADKRGVKVCINWKRGMCKFGDRCIYNHGEIKNQLQAAVDSNISPLEKDLVGYRIASSQKRPAGEGGLIAGPDGKMVWTDVNPPPPPDQEKSSPVLSILPSPSPSTTMETTKGSDDSTADWYNCGSAELALKTTDREAITKSIQEAKKVMSNMETDFTKVAKKKSKWD
eukprot:GFUD01021409.1.p1 GENE.GFUD01021409.1~~GFUD01021409.1.p1  ORF type:complete len:816 (+),score=239.01 GFUD01021409.1:110-2557(+)